MIAISSNKRNGLLLSENNYFKTKCKALNEIIKNNVFENAAICDEISCTQEKLIIVQEECKFLTKKLKSFETQIDITNGNWTTVKKSYIKKKGNIDGKVNVNQTIINNLSLLKKGNVNGKVNVNQTIVNNSNTENKRNINDIVNVNQTKVNKSYPKKKGNINGVTKPKCPHFNRNNFISETPKPVTIGEVTIFNFGQIVYDTPFYYSDCAIYSVGYYATRTYAHFRNIYSKCTYHCKVMKSGSSPRFEIMDHDKHFKVTGLSTDECHNHLLSLINKMLGNDDLMFATNNGDRFFGLSLPLVRLKLQENPESKFCTGYIPKLQVDIEEEVVAENDPSVSFEGLHSWLQNYPTFY